MSRNASTEDLLAELRRGPASAPDLTRRLGVSQPTVSRLVARAGAERVLVVGRARATRYAARRVVPGVGDRVPVTAIDAAGAPTALAVLHAVHPRGYWVEPAPGGGDALDAGFHADWPWFLDDLRPSGFLGRMVPRVHRDLGAPAEINLWSADHTLAFLTHHGVDLAGDLVVGDAILGTALAAVHHAGDTPIAEAARPARYAELAARALAFGLPGAAIGGDQPKFTATRLPGPIAVLVKFSPEVGSGDAAQRVADLLVAEHVALETLRAFGREAPRSDLVVAGTRLCLEVERFDRVLRPEGGFGRRGVVSAEAVDGGLVGRLASWVDTAQALFERRLIDAATVDEIRWRALFGRLVANSDMHHGNLGFWVRGQRLMGVAPIYDMLPMAYAPQAGNLRPVRFEVAPPSASELAAWPSARAAAEAFWRTLAAREDVSPRFQTIARTNARLVAASPALA